MAGQRAAELDERMQRTDDLLDEIAYDLRLTDEEIAIVEETVGEYSESHVSSDQPRWRRDLLVSRPGSD